MAASSQDLEAIPSDTAMDSNGRTLVLGLNHVVLFALLCHPLSTPDASHAIGTLCVVAPDHVLGK
eukprot:308611-Amphidinium_carterae.2